MRHTIILAPQAVSELDALKANLRATVKDAIERHLRHKPMKTSKSRIKRLRGLKRPQYRLRVDDVRVFYDVRDEVVEILAIIAKWDVDEWLGRVGEREVTGDDDEKSGAV